MQMKLVNVEQHIYVTKLSAKASTQASHKLSNLQP